MEYSLSTKCLAELIGTAILLIFGNGTVADVALKRTKGAGGGWISIAAGYGFGVMVPVFVFGPISGAHINPAMSLAQAANGMFPWSEVVPYIVAQLAGAAIGQLIVYVVYYPHYQATENPDEIFGTFATFDATGSKVNFLLNEFFGTMILAFASLACILSPWGQRNHGVASALAGCIIFVLITAFGGATGPCLNPARDLMPRLLHRLLPIRHKGSSRWNEAWIPILAPVAGALAGVWLWRLLPL